MQFRTVLLLVVFLTIVVETLSDGVSSRKSNSYSASVLDRRDRKNNDYSKYDSHDHVEDDYVPSSSNRRNRYPSYSSSAVSNDYTSRTRWPAQYENPYDADDWSDHSYGFSKFLSTFPGTFLSEMPFQSGPTCHSLVDPQYALFSDICGAVPQARYSLPNSFGHVEKWQIAQALTTILDPMITPPGCTRSLRLLLCPLLFPPCSTPFDAPPVLPCQPFCRAIKNQCAAPALDLLPCELLPPVSDLCPINPSPYSSLLSSFAQPLPFNGGLPPTALSSILTQSALSQLDMPLSPFSSFLASANPPLTPPSVTIPSPFPSLAPSVNVPFAPTSAAPSPPFQSSPPSGYPALPTASSAPPMSFQSLVSSQNPSLTTFPSAPTSSIQSIIPSLNLPAATLSELSSSAFPSLLPPPALPSSPFASLFSGTSMSPFPPGFNPFSNMDPFSDTLTPILVDFPPRRMMHDYRQRQKYFPMTRSATEKV
ncbi:unnamed protein product [Adineta ricciae]|uniref:FZ domain-containing protein n=1 Tax=Adineta ricciae TaxID=249248 RepID=A0A814FRD4_ADIRI|nr:unnamed protein product [Adineta ricciae]CAF1073091.1 unnamed protein product [Adineta ricciae]